LRKIGGREEREDLREEGVGDIGGREEVIRDMGGREEREYVLREIGERGKREKRLLQRRREKNI